MALLDINLNPDRKQLRIFGLAGAVVLALIAFLLHSKGSPGFGPRVFWILSALLCITVFAGPRLSGIANTNTILRNLRLYAFRAAALCLALGLLLRVTDRSFSPLGLWLVAGLLALAAVAAPQNLRSFNFVAIAATLPIGFVLGHLAMGLIYFGIFTPVAIFFRLIGRDAMCRKFDPTAESYWVPRRKPEGDKRYFRQF